MFSLKKSDQIPISSSQQKEATIHHNHIMDPHDSTNLTQKDTSRKRLRRSSSSTAVAGGTTTVTNNNNNMNEEKRVIHRDIERQRRQDMAKLYSSLRSLLPLEYIKGNRSICDHMHQAVGYINHLQGKIQDLEIERDKLKKLHDPSDVEESSNRAKDTNVTVSSCRFGIEILVSSCLLVDDAFSLSRIMEVLAEEVEGINVINCFSTIVNQRLLHIIQSQVGNLTCIDLSALQQKLKDKCKQG